MTTYYYGLNCPVLYEVINITDLCCGLIKPLFTACTQYEHEKTLFFFLYYSSRQQFETYWARTQRIFHCSHSLPISVSEVNEHKTISQIPDSPPVLINQNEAASADPERLPMGLTSLRILSVLGEAQSCPVVMLRSGKTHTSHFPQMCSPTADPQTY